VVVDLDIVAQRRLKLGCRAEPGLVDDVANAAIEALHHAIGLRMSRWDKTMLNVELLAKSVENVLPARFLLLALAGETVGELAAVVREQCADLDWTGSLYFSKKVDTAAFGLASINFDEDLTGSSVNGDKQIASRRLVWHLWQVFDVDMQKARLVILEGLLDGWHAAFLFH
jgi:hypothetical protein